MFVRLAQFMGRFAATAEGNRRPRSKAVTLWAAAVALALSAVWSVAPARAQDDDALKILKSMSDYLASQKTISLSYD